MTEIHAALDLVLSGIVVSGLGKATGFTQLEWVQDQFERKLGYRSWPGTFNLRILDQPSRTQWRVLTQMGGIPLDPPRRGVCFASCYPVLIAERLKGAIVLPRVSDYPADQIEIIAEVNVRERLGLIDGDAVTVRIVQRELGT